MRHSISVYWLLAAAATTQVLSQDPIATPSVTVISGDGPPAPALTVTASTGSWKPATPTGSLPPAALDGMGRGLHINSANDFCLLMPPNPVEQNLVDAEAVAVAYCMNPTNTTRPMPDSFIKSAHFRKTDDYVLITGTYDPAVMNLGSNDCGGEYDNHGAEGVGNPVGAFATLPDGTQAQDFHQFMGACDNGPGGEAIFCLRACFGENSYAYCNNQYDLMGCLFVDPGDYDAGFSSCDADPGMPVGVYNSSYTFHQGDAVTPVVPVPAPSSSNCQSVSPPSSSGVTYTWNQAVAQPTSNSNSNSNSNSGSNSNSNSNSDSNSNNNSGSNTETDANSASVALAGVVFSGFGLLLACIVLL